jgi:DNA-binding LacI/PurR family transcriptional regulator
MTDIGAPHPKSRGAARRATRRGPTIDDVARVAGVSRGTVSRVLNGGHYVSPAAQRAVEMAMTETGYVVNTSARALVTRRSNAVAVVLSEPQERLFEDPNFSVLLRSASQRLAESDLSMVLMIAGNADERDRVARFARAGHVDGALLVSTHAGDPIFDELKAARVPVVACGKPLDREDKIPFVAADDREGARQMVHFLRESGRERIATITGPLDTSGGRDRLAGYRDVLGDEAPEARIVPARQYTYKAGEEAMERLLGRAPDIDAVFVASDLLAAGALASLRRAGRTVPDDIAIGGFDDSQIALATAPPLTTIRNPLDLVAVTMVDMVIKHIAKEPIESQLVPTVLVRRESA